MRRWFKWGLGIVAIAFLTTGSMRSASAEDATTAPAKGTITGVARYDGQPANGVTVRLLNADQAALKAQRHARRAQATSKPTKAEKAARAAAKPQPVLTTTTDDNGHFTFKDVPPGTYAVAINLQKQANGKARVYVTAGQVSTVTVELRVKKTKL
jgi:hypothetical protein